MIKIIGANTKADFILVLLLCLFYEKVSIKDIPSGS